MFAHWLTYLKILIFMPVLQIHVIHKLTWVLIILYNKLVPAKFKTCIREKNTKRYGSKHFTGILNVIKLTKVDRTWLK